ncbi:nucleoside diphosphate-linked moiety X motif 17-like isoform X2 [Aquarana catesbeiana]|uniref:nucleoside diphosphate-linked moiety X motif 17-like isoform X1 n=1 Tax=Aquarana catesbeiana TaxID=8400 RepID=UPI003CCA6900
MESAKRILVYLSKENSLLQCARFVQGITGHFSSGHEDKAVVNCGLDQDRFVISDRPFSGSSGVRLQRSSFCPIKILNPDQAARLPEQIRGRGVDVGVAILLQTANKKVLLTRRTKTLSIFPNVWVPPGGHMEPGEQSTFPPLLSRGLPTRHHIVTFLLVTSSKTHQELQEKLHPAEEEVSACVWLDPEIAERIVAAQEGEEDSGKILPGIPTSVQVTEVSGNSLSRRDVDVLVFLNTAPVAGEDVERMSTGTKYALELWLETLQAREYIQPYGRNFR